MYMAQSAIVNTRKLTQHFFLSFAADILVFFLEYSQQHGVIVDSRMVVLFEYE